MKKRLLSFCLVILLCICNVAEVSAYETQGTYNNEEIADEMISSETTDDETGIEDMSSMPEETTEEENSSEIDTACEDSGYEESLTMEGDSEEIELESTKENYHVDKTAPYSGEYLIITNSSKIFKNAGASTGTSSNVVDDNEELIPDAGFDGFTPGEGLSENITLEATILGEQRELMIKNSSDQLSHKALCECVSIGEHCTVWVPVSDPIYMKSKAQMCSYMNNLSREFDAKYPTVTSVFGSLECADRYGDDDGKVALICYDIYGDAATKTTGYTSGLFSGKDMNVLFASATGNNMDCLHIDSWQAMKRSSDGLVLNDIGYVYETMVHELQHMIMWSNMRALEEKEGAVTFAKNVPDWANEGYSEAAVHLCYGKSTGRVERYNEGAVKGGRRSVLKWNADVDSYALSYIFLQYIRTQYAQISGDDGFGIYSRAIARLTDTSEKADTENGAAILDAIAAELGVTSEEVIENFWIALFMLDATGPYGFNGEEWAEKIQPQVTSSKAASLIPGASQVITNSSDYTPSSYGEGIVFAGLSRKNPIITKESLEIEGGGTLSTIGATLQLTAKYKGIETSEVSWSIPSIEDRDIISIDENGKVTALSGYGMAVVRATSVKDSSNYSEVQIEVLHDPTKDIQLNVRQNYSGYGQKTLAVTASANAKIYYVFGDSDATISDTMLTGDGIVVAEPGPVTINLLAVADGYYSVRKSETVSLERMTSPAINVTITDDSKFIINISGGDADGEIYYTLDGSSPAERGVRYGQTPVKVAIDKVTKIRAITRKRGYLDSYISEDELDEYPHVDFSDIVTRPIYGGYKMEISSTDKAVELRYTFDGSMPTRSSSLFPKNGLNLSVGQNINLKVTGWKSGCIPTTKVCELTIDKMEKPKVTASYIGYLNGYQVTIEQSGEVEDALLTYRINSGKEITYTAPFFVDAEVDYSLSAYAMALGVARSDIQVVKLEKVEPPYRRLTAVPRMVPTSVTLNRQQDGDICVPVSLMSMEGEEVLSCELTGNNSDAFEISHIEDDEWLLRLKNPSIKDGSYKLTLLMRGTEYEEEPVMKANLTVKLINKKPTVTLKKVTAYKNYTGTIIPLLLSSKDGSVEICELKNNIEGFTDNFELLDIDGDGKYDSLRMRRPYNNLVTDSKNKPVIAGKLSVKVAGYISQDIPLNVTISSAMPKITQTIANPINNYDSFVEDDGKATIALMIVNAQNKKVPFAVSSEEAVKINVNSKAYDKISAYLDPVTPVSVDGNGNIVIKYNTGLEVMPTGAQQVPLLISGESDYGSFNEVQVTAKFTIEKQTTPIKAVFKPAKLSLNTKTNDHAYAAVTVSNANVRIKDIICTAMPAKGTSNLDEKVKLRFNSSKNCLEAYFDTDPRTDEIVSKNYQFECLPVYVSALSGAEVNSDQIIKVTVNMINKEPVATVSAKGKIDVLNRSKSYIRYTVKKNGFGADYKIGSEIEPTVKIIEPLTLGTNELDGSSLFKITSNTSDFVEDNYVDIRLKNNVAIDRGKKYVLRLAFFMENGEYVSTANLKITPTQPTVAFKQDIVPTLYRNVNMRKRVAVITFNTGDYEIDKISLNALKNARLTGFNLELSDTDKNQIKVTMKTKDVKAGKYVINLDVIYKDEMLEKDGKPKIYPVNCNVLIK